MLEYPKERKIICIDLKSFYASCECVLRGLDPMNTKLVVAGNVNRQGSIVLAITPALKKTGLSSRCRLYEVPKNDGVIIVQSRMKRYLEISQKVVEIYLRYVPFENLHIYSVDEAFLDVTNTYHLFAENEVELALKIMNEIIEETKIPSSCGVGPNLLIAKLALDLDGKKRDTRIAKWSYEDIPDKLWHITPLSEMWGIGSRLEKSLNQLGLYKIGDIANYSIDKLRQKFGVIGEELYYHSHGIDYSVINSHYTPKSKGYSIGQMLFEDYYYNIKAVMLEQCEELGMRIRKHKRIGKTISLGIGYGKSVGGGFSRQMTMDTPTNLTSEIYDACLNIFNNFYDGSPIRKINIGISGVENEQELQLDLFSDRIKERDVARAVDEIRNKYGKNTILRGVSYSKDGTARKRNGLIGGHNAE